MVTISIQDISLWIFAALTWIVIMLGLIQLSRFFSKFQEVRRDLEGNLLGIAGQIKQMQGTLTELLGEQRRVTRLMLEQLELKRAEMTGDFDIVEEPITPIKPLQGGDGAAAAPGAAAPAPGVIDISNPPGREKLAPPPSKCPKL